MFDTICNVLYAHVPKMMRALEGAMVAFLNPILFRNLKKWTFALFFPKIFPFRGK